MPTVKRWLLQKKYTQSHIRGSHIVEKRIFSYAAVIVGKHLEVWTNGWKDGMVVWYFDMNAFALPRARNWMSSPEVAKATANEPEAIFNTTPPRPKRARKDGNPHGT
jgi:hypothetical protein